MFGSALECLRFHSVVPAAGALWRRLSGKGKGFFFFVFLGPGTGGEKPWTQEREPLAL